MKSLKNFQSKLLRENVTFEAKEQPSKELAKEDALTLIAEFVRDVKKKFPKKEDKLEILKDAQKTLNFFINEILNSGPADDWNDPVETIEPVSSFDADNEEDDEEEFDLGD